MKKSALILFATMALVNVVNAQRRQMSNDELPTHIIKTNVLPMLAGQIPFTNEYRLVYEQKTGQRTALQLTGAYLGKSPFVGLFERYVIDSLGNDVRLGVGGFRMQAALKFYVLKNQSAPKGFYVAPNFSFAYAKIRNKNNNDDYLNATYSSASALAGYQFIIAKHFAVDVYAGIGVKYNHYGFNIPVKNSDFYFDRLHWTGPKFWLGFNMGYAF